MTAGIQSLFFSYNVVTYGKGRLFLYLKQSLSDDRITEIARYFYEEAATVRKTAAVFGISKSTVHKELSVRLKEIDGELYKKVRDVLQLNKQQRHIRGGNATRLKYESMKKK